ncbi:MAG: patatin-like phospholipase family protein [Micrococcales bacterium]|nr:patatin-like phospholipase family protein [Micrococcales bacterium]
MSIAFVFSGGGSLGAVQVGMVRALHEHGVAADLLVGTSAGALNAAYLARHGQTVESLDHLSRAWASLHRDTIFHVSPHRAVLALTGRRPSFFSARGLRTLLVAELGDVAIEDLDRPLLVVTTDLRSGRTAVLSSGDAISAILASAAIPGILPPVEREGSVLVDGGLADHGYVLRSVAEQVEQIYLLPTGSACALPATPRSALGVAAHALTLLIQQGLGLSVAQYLGPASLHVMPPLCPLGVSPVDFSHGASLIARAYEATAAWLENPPEDRGPAQAGVLSLHSHAPTSAHSPRT